MVKNIKEVKKNKQLILHSRINPSEYREKLIKLKIPHIVSLTSSSCSIKHNDRKVIFSNGDLKKPEMILQQQLKREIKNNFDKLNRLQKNKITGTHKPNYFKFDQSLREMEISDGEILCFENVYAIDITKAYYYCAFNSGLLSESFFKRTLAIPKFMRLRLLGSIATLKHIYNYNAKGELVSVDTKYNKLNRKIWDYIVNEIDTVIQKCADALQKQFLFYWVDGIFFKERDFHNKLSQNLVTHLLEKNNYKYTVKKLDKIELYHFGKTLRLEVYKDGESTGVYTIPKKQVKKYILLDEIV